MNPGKVALNLARVGLKLFFFFYAICGAIDLESFIFKRCRIMINIVICDLNIKNTLDVSVSDQGLYSKKTMDTFTHFTRD